MNEERTKSFKRQIINLIIMSLEKPTNAIVGKSIAILLVGFLIILVHYSVRYGYGILLPEMMPSLGISKLEAGIIYTSYFVGYTVFSLFLGIMVDNIDARKIVTLFLLALGAGTFSMSLSNTLMGASLSFMLAGIGCAACWVPVVVVVQRWFKKRAFAVAIVNVGAPIGFAATGIFLPILVKIGSWTLGWRMFSVASFVLAPLAWLFFKAYPEGYVRSQSKNVGKNFWRESVIILKNIKLWLVGFSYMLVGFYIMIPFTFLSTYGSQEIGLRYEHASLLVSMIAVGAIPGTLVLASFSEFIGRLKTMFLCGGISILGLLGVVLAQNFPDLKFAVLAVSAAVYGAGYGAVWPLYTVLTSDLFSMEHAGTALGLMTIFLGLGCMLSPPLAGWMADTTGSLKSSFLLAVSTTALSLLFLLPLRKR
ncbi:MAG: MFS transporter [Candidatus Bathyarchaeia archaeon]